MLSEATFLDHGVGPHLAQQVPLLDQMPRMRHQHGQGFEGLGAQRNGSTMQKQATLGGLESKGTKLEGHRIARVGQLGGSCHGREVNNRLRSINEPIVRGARSEFGRRC